MPLTYQAPRRTLLTTMKRVLVLLLLLPIAACGGSDGATKKACQSLRDVSFDSVNGPLYDHASPSFKRLYDKMASESVADLPYYFDADQMGALCSKYGVKGVAASMKLSG